MERRILISRFSALGDVAMCLPAIYDACVANPDDKFFFITKKHQTQMFINTPENLQVLTVDLENYKGMTGIWRLVGSLKKRYGITMMLDLHDVLRTKLMRTFFRLRGVSAWRIHKGRAAKKKLTRSRKKVMIQLKTTPERYQEVFQRAGVALARDDRRFRSIFGAEKGDTSAFAEVSAPKQPGEQWIAIAPFAQHQGKIYPFERIERIVEHFAAKENTRLFLFGFGKEETTQIDSIARRFPEKVVNMAAAGIGIGRELSLLSYCDLMVSMDSANMHLASLVGVRCVSIWGATHPYAGFMGVGQNPEDAVGLEMVCRPCSVYGNKPCLRGDYHCLKGISPQLVIKKIESALS